MDETASNTAKPPRKRRWLKWFAVVMVVLLVLFALAIRALLQPERATALMLKEIGDSLGLEITSDGPGEYDLQGTPRLVLRGVRARQPGAARDVLRAERIYLALPWSTLRSKGHDLQIERIELDAPLLDLAAWQAWQATRPKSETRWPTLTRGLQIRRGSVLGEGWRLSGFDADLPRFARNEKLQGRIAGRYEAAQLAVPFALDLAMSKPAADAGVGLAGDVAVETPDWRLPLHLRLSAPLHVGEAGIELHPAKLGAHGTYIADETRLPFALGTYGPLRISSEGLSSDTLALNLHGGGVVPTFTAQGKLQLRGVLALDFAGSIAEWPKAWPTLPSPLNQSKSPLPFAITYQGDSALNNVIGLELHRDATHFNGALRVREVIEWNKSRATQSPLPPITGRLVTPRIETGGATLEGVEVTTHEPSIPAQP